MARVAFATVLVLMFTVVGIGALVAADSPASTGTALAADTLPPAAEPFLEVLVDAGASCPQMPLPRVAAHITVESGWDPRAVNAASGAAGLVQFMADTWTSHGPGGPWSGRPPTDHPVFDPATHLDAAMSLFCANHAAMQAHLASAGKPVSLLDAVAVCHVAGCSRVTASASGIPGLADAAATGCHRACVITVRTYLDRINELTTAYTATGGGAPEIPIAGLPPPPRPYPGGPGGCTEPDPTTAGCITPATLWLYRQVLESAGGTWPAGIGCHGQRPTNPTSDHPTGRACDLTIGRIGDFPTPDQRQHGWTWAEWLRTYATPLHVTYIVWDGKIWNANRRDEGWRTYDPGNAYDPTTPTGGHFDHIHVSLAN